LGWFPRFTATTTRSDFPNPPRRSLAFTRRFRTRIVRSTRDLPCSSATYATRAPIYDPDGTLGAGLRDYVPTYCSADIAFRACRLVGFHHVFLSGSNSAAHVLAVYASQRGSPLYHARLASGWWPYLSGRESNPLGRYVRFHCVLAIRSHHPPDRSFKAHGKIKGLEPGMNDVLEMTGERLEPAGRAIEPPPLYDPETRHERRELPGPTSSDRPSFAARDRAASPTYTRRPESSTISTLRVAIPGGATSSEEATDGHGVSGTGPAVAALRSFREVRARARGPP